ncbi:MAG TPA: HU family DNA-binding protein [Terriglobales bacterium]|nr:HU family DNA-binding protein [Terriglobales bacterium]
MNRSDVALAMAQASGLPKNLAERALNAALAAVAEELASGRRVTLAGFGAFRPVARRARTGRDPRTGGKIHIAPRNSVLFVLSPELKNALNATPVAAAATAGGEG